MRELTIKNQQVIVISDSEKKRCDECPHRFPGQCKLINNDLGYPNHLALTDCDRCWAMGGESGGAQVRSAYVSRVVGFMRLPANFRKLPLTHAKSFAAKHMTEEESAPLLALPRTNHQARDRAPWLRAKGTFEAADSFIRSMKSRGFTGRKVDLTIKGERHVSCFGTSLEGLRVSEPCPALGTASDGRHFCNECLCGETELAMLDGEGYIKLDYPYLVCARQRPGFSNVNPVYTSFDRTVCISLRRRSDRWASFKAKTEDIEWPLPIPRRFEAIDGGLVPAPPLFMSGPGAWGCLRSHGRVLEEAILDGLSSIVVFEDDAWFVPDFADRLREFMDKVPEDWEGLMLGGQHIGWPEVKPISVKPSVVRCVNCQRTHAYAVRGKLLRDLYQKWTGWQPHWGTGHADIIMGPFMANYNVYAPEEFLVAQDEGTSDINGASNSRKHWDVPKIDAPVIFLNTKARPSPNKLRGRGYHMGYDIDMSTGMDKGVLAISLLPPPWRISKWKEWLFIIKGEAAVVGAKAIVWAPYDGAMEEVKEAAGAAFVLMEDPNGGIYP